MPDGTPVHHKIFFEQIPISYEDHLGLIAYTR